MTHQPLAPIPVPPMGKESHLWHPDSDSYLSRSERMRETGEYWSAVPPKIADLSIAVPADVSATLEESARALGELDAYAGAKFGMKSRVLGPMSSILLRTESTSSSQIENLTVGAKNLALQELGEGKGGNAAVVVGNVHAMESALALSETFDKQHLLSMHKALLSAQPELQAYAGRFRDQLVWVGGSSSGPVHARHVGPQPNLVEPLIDDMLAYLQRDDLPVILQCAIAHAQFETIHPFVDGNGRVGRALVHAVLRNKGLIRNVTPPVSAGLLTDTRGYFDALMAYRRGDARPIVECLAYACRYASATGIQLIEALDEQLEQAREKLSGVRRDAAAWKVLPILIEQPIINQEYLTSHLGLGMMTAHRAVDTLEERGVLDRITGGRRNKVWIHRGVLQVLDEYAAQLRRR
ncbi:Fic family protein [Bifidobacterium reuteri]|uniref:Filamentation induced by cAMP protein fic n=3 Tax=Bifidobacterium TaxID=1678 RepID=A0A087CXJ4_9BIFI|nr:MULTISPECIES: Fic family protein [Bifidobacterium]TPF82684.1 Fic family protein [Bifidobacterium sp. UTCIF-3]KAA8825252.1 Fic family protein [Bifidobacterium reuteri]KFI87994.1 filamentation induced by cAMP protein fic [Bifidobacterium reuteri DSM 23975]TPF78595.1 Fic family protein [Bifidobacterium sp. UTCIF-1]TPF80876.1 Fic family protein [Bifidobacterium sp. UTCIF-24]